MRKVKGQVFLPDFVSSVAMFSFILVFFMLGWNNLVGDNFNGEREDLVSSAERSKTLLLDTEGYPTDWNGSDVKVPGFREGEYIDPSKVVDMKGIVEKDRNRLLKNAHHNFTLFNNGKISTFNGTRLTFGSQMNETGNLIVLREDVVVNKSGEKIVMEAMYSEWD